MINSGTSHVDHSTLTSNISADFPSWVKDGTYIVYRRLRTLTGKYREFVEDKAKTYNYTTEYIGALIFGRWPNGEPLVRENGPNSPAPDSTLGSDKFYRNNFTYTLTNGLAPLDPTLKYPPDPHPPPSPDPLGIICPFAAHIRKMNPRDSSSDQGPNQVTLRHKILRRASNYGQRSKPGETNEDNTDRGLLFFCYQTDLQDQFEFLQNQWANRTDPPIPGGHDLIIGQNLQPGEHRQREFQVYIQNRWDTWKQIEEFVIPTGSGYFFTPSLKALKEQFIGIPIKK
jgi:Dyp-type peroxidase family